MRFGRRACGDNNDKLLGIQMIDKGCANAEYIIRLRKE